MENPYLITGPALVSFSGGRTSAYMLYQILQAHGGKLPNDVIVAFANTGKEREETLRFVHECSTRWNVKVHWIEWRRGKPGFEEVGFNSASRAGEPFDDLIAWKQRLPNSFERWCTEFLKVKPMFALVKATLGLTPGEFTETIGLRDDEGIRIFRGMDGARQHGRRVAYPLAKAKVRKRDVWDFWWGEGKLRKDRVRPQGFDLELDPYEGNCDFCFQKGKGIRKRLIRDGKTSPIWWSNHEIAREGWFDKRDTMAELIEQVRSTPSFFDEYDDQDYDVECGLHCAPGEAA